MTDEEFRRAWQRAAVMNRANQRNRRGRRTADPYRRGQYLGVVVQPPKKEGEER